MTDAHEVLGLGPHPSPAEVRATYRALARIHHPDRFADARPEQRRAAEGRMAEINAAYAALNASFAGGTRSRTDGWRDPVWVAHVERVRAEESRRTTKYRRWEELERRARQQPVTPRLAPERRAPAEAQRPAREPVGFGRDVPTPSRSGTARRRQQAMRADAEEVLRAVEQLRVVLTVEDERPRRRLFRRS